MKSHFFSVTLTVSMYLPGHSFAEDAEDFIAAIEARTEAQIVENLNIIGSQNYLAACLLLPHTSDVLADHSRGDLSTDQAKMLMVVALLQDKAIMMEAGFSGIVHDEVCKKRYNTSPNGDFATLISFGISYFQAR